MCLWLYLFLSITPSLSRVWWVCEIEKTRWGIWGCFFRELGERETERERETETEKQRGDEQCSVEFLIISQKKGKIAQFLI
jgi:hypothetical protein